MGEMADYAIDQAFEQLEHYYKYKGAPLHIQYEEGLIDENGAPIGDARVFTPRELTSRKSYKAPKASGEGPCPKCEGPTKKRSGPYGMFYGCMNYPQCKGTRSL